MRSLLILLIVVGLFDVPVYSRHSRDKDCDMHLECKKGNKVVQSWQELGKDYVPWRIELARFFKAADKLGIKLYITKAKHFGDNNQGVYNVVYNNIYLNEDIIKHPLGTVRVLRHEIWHAVQDCAAGGLSNTSSKSIFSTDELPEGVKKTANDLYKHTSDKTKEEEAGAIYVSTKRYKSVESLEECARKEVKL